jgi:hypothetical protein
VRPPEPAFVQAMAAATKGSTLNGSLREDRAPPAQIRTFMVEVYDPLRFPRSREGHVEWDEVRSAGVPIGMECGNIVIAGGVSLLRSA